MSHWKVLESKVLFTAGFFRLKVDKCELPDGRVMPRYYVMELPDWVNVVALTPDRQMILVRQHRHGADGEFLEVPGGSTHPGGHEDPLLAGERELLEETGFRPREMVYCGYHFPNPALQSNKMHTYLALDCEKVSEPQLDPFECLDVVMMKTADAIQLWREGGFKHSLIAASLGLSLRELEGRGLV